jgi:hypothetical protein
MTGDLRISEAMWILLQAVGQRRTTEDGEFGRRMLAIERSSIGLLTEQMSALPIDEV